MRRLCFPSQSPAPARRRPVNRSSGCWRPCRPNAPRPIAWGLNCGVGPDGLLGAVERAVRLTPLPVIVQPNAGMPKEVENRRIYLCSPEYLASYAKRYVALGAAAVGGCCGTTPEHIREVALAVKPLGRPKVLPPPAPVAGVQPKTPAPLAEKSQFGARLAGRQWVTTVELLPPRGYDLRLDGREGQGVAGAGRVRDQHPRRSAGQRPALVASGRRTHFARSPDRTDPALLLPRSEPDRNAGRPAGVCGLRRAEHPFRDRRSAQAGRLSARHRRVRCRLDRHDGRTAAAQLRHRPGRPGASTRPRSP